jgi:hypothetical protein
MAIDNSSPNAAIISAGGHLHTERSPIIHSRMSFTEIFDKAQSSRPVRSFIFSLNPHKLSVAVRKLENYILTKFGYERQFWGTGLFVFSYEGRTNVFRPPVSNTGIISASPSFDIRKTAAYIKFVEFQQFYFSIGNNNIEMSYWGYDNSFTGSLDDFSFSYDAERPFHIDYRFKFTAIPTKPIPISLEFNDAATRDDTKTVTPIPQLDPATGQA